MPLDEIAERTTFHLSEVGREARRMRGTSFGLRGNPRVASWVTDCLTHWQWARMACGEMSMLLPSMSFGWKILISL